MQQTLATMRQRALRVVCHTGPCIPQGRIKSDLYHCLHLPVRTTGKGKAMLKSYAHLQRGAQVYLDATKDVTRRAKLEDARYEFVLHILNSFRDDWGMDWKDEESTSKDKPLTRLANAIVKG